MRKSKNYYKFLNYVSVGNWYTNTICKYGKGFVRVVPCYYNGKPSTKYMTIQYWVEK